jgi:hypothetical protein
MRQDNSEVEMLSRPSVTFSHDGQISIPIRFSLLLTLSFLFSRASSPPSLLYLSLFMCRARKTSSRLKRAHRSFLYIFFSDATVGSYSLAKQTVELLRDIINTRRWHHAK